MRLRTLPLSLSGSIIGIAIAGTVSSLSVVTVIFLILTTCSLQILSNLSNELGDILSGTDTSDRQGMHYAVMDGEMTVKELKILVGAAAADCCIWGSLMIWCSFGTFFAPLPLGFLFLGACAIYAAMKYTLGKNPYGYRGLGDIFVFLFFGLVNVIGAKFICCHQIGWTDILPGAAIGFFSIGVLNVNNIRDMKTDARTRTTVAIKLGLRKARIYQTILILAGWAMMIWYSCLTANRFENWLYLNALPVFYHHLREVWSRVDKELDPMLPELVISTFLMALIFAIFQ